MSDWIDTLEARREGLVEGFHGAQDSLDKLDEDQVPATGTLAPESDAPAPPLHPVESATGGHRAQVAGRKTAAKKAAAKKTSSTTRKR